MKNTPFLLALMFTQRCVKLFNMLIRTFSGDLRNKSSFVSIIRARKKVPFDDFCKPSPINWLVSSYTITSQAYVKCAKIRVTEENRNSFHTNRDIIPFYSRIASTLYKLVCFLISISLVYRSYRHKTLSRCNFTLVICIIMLWKYVAVILNN